MTPTPRRALAAVLILPLVAAACGGDDTGADEVGAAEPTTEAATETIQIGSTLDLAPMEFVDESGNPTGFEIEVVEALADELGVEVDFVQTPFDQAFTGLQAEKYRANASGIFVRCERVEDTEGVGEFTVPYYEDGQVFATHADRADEIQTFEDLAGLTLGVESAGSTADSVSDANNPDGAFKKEIFSDQTSLILALQQGRIDAAMQSGSVMRYSIRDIDDLVVSAQIEETVRPVAMVFRAGDELRDEFNEAINTLKDEGVIAEIYESWFNVPADPDSPMVNEVPEVTTDTCLD